MVKISDIGSIGNDKLLVLSDLHVGDPRHHPDALADLYGVVRAENPRYLVLAGDVLEGNLANSIQINQLQGVCRLADHTVVLRGNHDLGTTKRFANLIGGQYRKELIGISKDTTFMIQHGDRFDPTWRYVPWLGWIGVIVNRFMYYVFQHDLQAALRRLQFVHRKLLRQHAKAWSEYSNYGIVVTGHTHLPTNDPSGLGYFNSGDWLLHRSACIIQSGVAATKMYGHA